MEKASIDEFYIDLSGMDRFFNPYEWTIDLRAQIIRETGLPISFGLASNKLVAKIATDEAKPNGFLYIPPGREEDFLAPLKVNKIPGVGKETNRVLTELGIETIADIRRKPLALLEKHLGKYGAELYQKAKGIHLGEVVPYREAKSVSTENTFEDNLRDLDFIMEELVRMTEKVAFELRQDNKLAGCIAVKIRYPNFETYTRQMRIPYTFYEDELIPTAKELFNKLYRPGQAVRLLGVRLSELTGNVKQTDLFGNSEKKSSLYKAIDDVKNKFGKFSVIKAGGKK